MKLNTSPLASSVSLRPSRLKFLLAGLLLCLFSSPHSLSGAEKKGFTVNSEEEKQLKIVLPDNFLRKADAQSPTVTELLYNIEKIQDDYLTTLADENPFYGLYIAGGYEQDIDSWDNSHRIGLEWELFDEGWNESVQSINKKKVETKLQFLQMLANMQQKKLMEKLYFKNRIDSQIQGLISKKKSAVLETLQESRKKQFQNGYVTKDDYLTVHYKYQNSALLASHYGDQETVLLNKPIFDIINRCESIVLLPTESLLKLAIDNSVQIQIQDFFIQRSDFFPSWSDDLRLKLYAQNVHWRDGDKENIMGISIRVPIMTNGSRSELVSTEQNVYLKQKEAIVARLGQRIPGIIARLSFHQQRIIIASNEYMLMQERLSGFSIEEKSSIPIFDRTPRRNLDLLEIELLDKELDILLARLKVYEELLKLEALVLPEHIRDMFDTPLTLSLHSQ